MNIRHYTLVLAIVAVLASSLGVSWFAMRHMERTLAPELHKQALAVGESISADLAKVVEYGAGYARLRGMDSYLGAVLREYPDLTYIVVTDRTGHVLYRAGDAAPLLAASTDGLTVPGGGLRETQRLARHYDSVLAVQAGGEAIGWVHLGQPRQLIQARLQDSLYDIVTIVLVAILISFELLLFMLSYTIGTPVTTLKRLLAQVSRGDFTQAVWVGAHDEIGRLTAAINAAVRRINDGYYRLSERINAMRIMLGNDAVDNAIGRYIDTAARTHRFTPSEAMQALHVERTGYIRPALFLLVFSESLSLAFFPLYVDSLYAPVQGLSREMVVGLPISVFMLVWALSLPGAGNWSDRVGRRRSFLVGALLTGVGLVLTAFARDLYELLAWRSVTALGYGIVFITCQGYITDHTDAGTRTRGMATFLAGFFSGSLCGAAVGGILANHLGYQMTFVLSAGLSVAAAVFVLRFIHDHAPDGERTVPKRAQLRDYLRVAANWRFIVLTCCAAIPAKIALTGFLYYTGPLYMKALGADQSAIGRVMMAYGLAMILVLPLVGRIADRLPNRAVLVFAGGLLSSSALLLVYFHHDLFGVIASITLLGIAHAIGVSPQVAMVTDLTRLHAAQVGLGATVGMFRLLERAGNVAGPLVAAALISAYGFRGVFLGIGAITAVGIVIFAVAFALSGRLSVVNASAAREAVS